MKTLLHISFLSLIILIGPLHAAEPLHIVREAYKTMEKKILQGHLQGVFRELKGSTEIRRANVEIEFQRPRYYAELNYVSHQEGLSRRIIVFDGRELHTSRFSSRISKTGAEGKIRDIRFPHSGRVRPQAEGFPWDPANLHKAVVNIERLIENVGDKLECKFDENDDIVMHYLVGKSPVTLKFLKKYDYRISSKEVYSSSTNVLLHKYEVDWKEYGDQWFVSRLLDFWPKRGTEIEFVVSEASIGKAPVPKRFTQETLDLPDGSRIIDRTSSGIQ